MTRQIEYEKFFESLLRRYSVSYLHVKATKRPMVQGVKVKNFDFIVFSCKGICLVDVKGYSKYYPDTNVSEDDVKGLKIWEQCLKQYTGKVKGLFVFLYQKKENEEFLIKCLDVKTYDQLKKPRARFYHKGGTVEVPRSLARKTLKNIEEFIPELRVNYLKNGRDVI